MDLSTMSCPIDLVRVLRDYRYRWLVPVVGLTVLAVVYALVRRPQYEATQSLIVRNDAQSTDRTRPGEFSQVEEMKTVQETILELARSNNVLAAALRQVGPQADAAVDQDWPSSRDVNALRGAVAVTAPNGAAFGTTEVIYLKVKNQDRRRAVQLAAALSERLRAEFQQIRNVKAQSMVDELAKTVDLAQEELDRPTAELAAFERGIGGDLAELRSMHSSPSGNSDLRLDVTEMERELRQARTAQRNNQELRRLLVESKRDQGRLLAAPSRLLESQPALRRLKDGLVDAQLQCARLLGTMSTSHPLVKAAQTAEQAISGQLHAELDIAIRGVEEDGKLTAARVASLTTKLAANRRRLANLAAQRARYGNLVAEVDQRMKILNAAQKDLADARATRAGSLAASLLNPLDVPRAGDYPTGLSRTMIALIGLVGGLATGLGLLFLTVQPSQPRLADAAVSSVPQPRVHPVKTVSSATTARQVPVASDLPSSDGLSLKQALEKLAVDDCLAS